MAARSAFESARAEPREWLTQYEARTVLAAYGIGTAPIVEATTPREAGEPRSARRQVALKIARRAIVHKSEVGGVVLNLVGGAAVEAAAARCSQRVRESAPGAAIRGFTVERDGRPRAGSSSSSARRARGDFGPLPFGEGGTAVEAVADTALELPPSTCALARQLISRTRIYKRMRGYRGVRRRRRRRGRRVIVQMSQLLADFPGGGGQSTSIRCSRVPRVGRPSTRGSAALDRHDRVSCAATWRSEAARRSCRR